MPARYTVVQYVPDPIADERINIGVIAFTEDRIVPRFLHDWSRVRRFGGADVSFLKAFARQLHEEVSPALFLDGFERAVGNVNAGSILSASENWMNSIQLTAPRAS